MDYFTTAGSVVNGKVQYIKDWHNIWFSFAAYALVLGIIFPLVFRYRHTTDGAAPATSEPGATRKTCMKCLASLMFQATTKSRAAMEAIGR